MIRTRNARAVLARPGAFALAVLRHFRANQGLLLAGAVAYYALLSLVPLLVLVALTASRFFPLETVLEVLLEYLEFVVPGQAAAIVTELESFLAHREAASGVLVATLLFFSAMAFTVLENAMSVIFHHRVRTSRRRFLVSAVLPYLFIVFLGLGLLAVTVVSGVLHRLGDREVMVFGILRSLDGVSVALLYALGVVGEVLLLTAIYLVMPVGRLAWSHALVGGITATILWEITRHVLVWYYATLSRIQLVYGSLSTAILVLLSVEIAAIVLLLGAQVIAEYERVGHEPVDRAAPPLTT